MEYREMTLEDYDAAYRLWESCGGVVLSEADSREEIAAYLKRNPGCSRICLDGDGVLIGTALCGHDGRRGFLYHVAVSEEHRGQGIGRELAALCLEALRGQGIAKCHIMVAPGNESGRRFWESAGWEYRNGIALYSRAT